MNMFDQAKTAAPAATKATAVDDRPRVHLEKLKEVTSMRALIKNLQAVADTLDDEVKECALDHFVETAAKHGRKPSNITGFDGDAEAVVTMNKRSSRSILSDEVVEKLHEAGISTDKTISVAEAFIINPVHAKNQAILSAVSEALKDVEGLPEDFIQFQAEVSATVTSKTTIDEVCETKDAAFMEEMLPLVSTLTIKPNSGEVNLGGAIRTIREILK